MAIGAGMTSAITNPLHAPEMMAIKGADVVMGHDPNCQRWIKAARSWGEAAVVSQSAAPTATTEAPKGETAISRRRLRQLRQAAGA